MKDTLFLYTSNSIQQKFDSISVITDSVISEVETTYETVVSEKENRILGMPQGAASIVIPTIIPTMVSIIVFCTGVFIERRREKKKEERERNKYKAAILDWIELLEAPIKTQINQLKDLAYRIGKAEDLQPEALNFSKSMANKINDLSVEKIISTFVIKEKNTHNDDASQAYNIVSQFDFLSTCDDEIKEKYIEYRSRLIELMEKWTILWKEFENLKENGNSSDNQNYDVWRTVFFSYKSWKDKYRQDGRIDYNIVSTELITPLLNTIIRKRSEYPSSKLAEQYYEVVYSLYLLLNEWNVLKAGYRDVFNGIANRIEQSYSVLVEAKKHFSKTT